ncbi:MAG: hypothetical protein CMH82_00300 [Nocardioides sp.]|nr:hypothetical protein [Nocardioides sp.]
MITRVAAFGQRDQHSVIAQAAVGSAGNKSRTRYCTQFASKIDLELINLELQTPSCGKQALEGSLSEVGE